MQHFSAVGAKMPHAFHHSFTKPGVSGVTIAADRPMASSKTMTRGEADDAVVDVCVCTFRRPSLRQTLESLARQDGAPAFRVIVADNDEQPSAEGLAKLARTELGLDIRYVHAPARNISVARNACLDAATADFIAFIDDDEVAPPGWLAHMFGRLHEEGLDVVFGPVKARYAKGAPAWAVRGDFHSFRPAFRANGEIDTGYSSNVLFRRSIAGALRFEPALGRTGGEDTMFFSHLHAAGSRLGFCAEGEVEEPTPLARANLGWLVKRSFRSGQTHARMLRERGVSPLAIAWPAAAKASYCALAAIATVWSPVLMRRNIVRGALHLGVVAKAFGAGELELYGASA